jgi:hypothetical protein
LSDAPNATAAYAQLFRNGSAEFADTYTLRTSTRGTDWGRLLPATPVEVDLMDGLKSYFDRTGRMGVQPPLIVLASLLGVRDCRIFKTSFNETSHSVDRDDLILPDVMVEDFDKEPATWLRPVFDAIWQAAGMEGSPNFNELGEWVEKRVDRY